MVDQIGDHIVDTVSKHHLAPIWAAHMVPTLITGMFLMSYRPILRSSDLHECINEIYRPPYRSYIEPI